MPKSVAARRRQRQRWIGVCLISGVLLILLPLAGWFVYASLNRDAVDKETGCLQRGFDSVVAVLIDTTDSLTPVQAASFKNLLEKLKADIPKYGRLEIYALQPITTKPLEPVFAACNPGSAADVPSRITGNPEMAQRRWTQQFGTKVEETRVRLLNMKPRELSPIFEAIQSVAVTAFETEQTKNTATKDLFIVSDFIENVPQMTMYKGVSDYSTFQQSQYYRQVRAKLYGVGVHMYWIPRATRKDVQTTRFRDFWREYVKDVGGESKEWTALQ